MAKQQTCQRYIYKIHSSRLRKVRWKLTLPLAEARRNEEIVSLADSQVLRWLDELNEITDADERAWAIKREIKRLRKEQNSVQNRRRIKQLYADLDAIQFKPDYMCLIIDREKDYYRACRGFTINGLKYVRLLGTNGGVKNETIVFVSERHAEEIRRRIENGRNPDMPLVPAKLEAYKALACSASTPVYTPTGVLVVSDCETEFLSDVVYLSDENEGEPVMEYRSNVPVQLVESDGYGIMLPSLAERWSRDLGLDYIVSGVNTRFAFEKGMVFTFDFLDFAEKVAGKYIVKDAWGNDVDIRDVELILTTSMVKLWDSYGSCEEYLRNCRENGYTIGITKACPKELENEHTLNYQFIQSYDLSDEDIEELIRPTMDEIRDVLSGDINKTILFMKGGWLNESNVATIEDDCIKALMIEPELIHDPYVQSKIYQTIRNRINEAKVGVLNVHGNYSMVSGDPYSLCQHVFGLEVTGLLKAGEIYNQYWRDEGADKLACFRAPMSTHSNIRAVHQHYSEEADYWYRYMTTSTVLNSWDTICHALNGCDKDGDLVMLTDNEILVNRLRELPALMCIQRKAEKMVPTEEDFVRSNIASFGDEIGKITNRVTSMYEVQSRFKKGTKEYEIIDYRIQVGQLAQQNAIDKSKGIIAKPMPRAWYDRHTAAKIEDEETRQLYLNIVAEKKPYFMRYIYPSLSKQYNTFIRNTKKSCLREFGLTVEELKAISEGDRTERQNEYLYYFDKMMPVGLGDCVMNRICRRFEEEFDGYLKQNKGVDFDYSILKGDSEYTRSQVRAVSNLYDNYNYRLRDYAVYLNYERIDEFEGITIMSDLRDDFERDCAAVCSDQYTLCDILIDICSKKSSSKKFLWDMCGSEIIHNLLLRNSREISFPEKDIDGEVFYKGERYTEKKVLVEVET